MLAAVAVLAAAVPGAAAEAARAVPQAVPRPAITRRFVPISAQRRRDTAAYARRHYGISTTTVDPRAVVIHFTANGSVEETWNTFAPNVADPELHERPGTCTQFVIARNGRIVQLTPVTFLCRHTVGLNWAAIGIEHVGFSDAEVLGNAAQTKASIRLVRWLRCTYDIQVRDVIGHAESLGSRFHRERVPALRRQTHGDFARPAMQRYRALVREAGC
jgi:N-acetyl-anhydromuramyl-L-alanine amidase AmpD